MKKLLLLLVIGSLSLLHADNKIYLENQSGKVLGIQVDNMAERILGVNNRMEVGNISINSHFLNEVRDLKIRVSHRFWPSSYVSFKNHINILKAYHKEWCSTGAQECYKDAVLVINSSSSGFSVSLRWENSGQPTGFSMKDFPSVNVKELLNAIKKHVEAQDYESVNTLINRYRNALSMVLSNGQITAILAGAHKGADTHQKAAAKKFIINALQK